MFAKRVSHKEACLRLVATVDGEDFDGRTALEQQELFKEVARSKVVEVRGELKFLGVVWVGFLRMGV